MQTAFVYDPLFLNHDTGQSHPERSQRLTAAHDLLGAQSWFGDLIRIKPEKASLDWVRLIHDSRYVDRVEQACSQGQRHIDSPDVSISPESCDVALNAAGSVIKIADQVVTGKVDNGFALVRPPGHHAEADVAMGFCLFNSIAIAARYLQKKHGLERILILDWDVHHGNGTQHIFEQDPSVFLYQPAPVSALPGDRRAF